MTDISYQLYSSRQFPPLAGTLKMLKDLGYTQVEGFGGLYGDVPGLVTALNASGMTMPSGHFSIDLLEKEPDRVFEIARATGMKALYCPHIAADQRPTDKAGWRAFGKRLEAAGKRFVDAGYVFGWHNHDFELRPQTDGSVPLEEIFKGGPNLTWEADLAWIVRGGADPFDWIKRHGGRMTSVHIKDIAPEGECVDEDGWADVGHGTMDWKGLWQAVRATPCQTFVMEHDKPNDDRRFARRSIQSVKGF